MNKDVIVVIPVLNPNTEIMDKFINKLLKTFENVVIVNDGSEKSYNSYFSNLEKKGIVVLPHYVNYGKGRAIKTAINYIYNNYVDFKTIVTADCDGQHAVEDILKCAKESIKCPECLVLGCRNFSKENVPFKSRYGNIITRNIFNIFIGVKITDTQTGLRAMSKSIAYKFLSTTGERFEYETKVLIDSKNEDIAIKEVSIDTIYINDNSESHFNPLKDSVLIYKLFAKYFFSSITSFILDIVLFIVFLNFIFINQIILCTIFARIISSIYNYLINKNLVFKKANKSSLIKYYILAVTQMFVSALSVSAIYKFVIIAPVIIKIIVDFIIFVVNFIIQREWVFKKH